MILKEKIIKWQKNKEKKKFLEKITQNYGLVKEEEDKIICYVFQNKIKENQKSNITCFGLDTFPIAKEKYNLDKPIYYIFENIIFPMVSISAIYANLIFKNCHFQYKTFFYGNGSITLQDNTYIYPVFHFYSSVHELILQNELLESPKIDIEAQKVTLINSEIHTSNIKINTITTDFSNSSINANEINLNSDNIYTSDSNMKASEINIENKNYDLNPETLKLDSNYIIYNKEKIFTFLKDISIIKGLYEKRKKLLYLLSIIKNNCRQTITQKICETKKELEQEPINLILKKDTK